MQYLYIEIKFNILKIRMRFINTIRIWIVYINHKIFLHKQKFKRITYKSKNKLRKYNKILIKTHNKLQLEKLFFKESIHLSVKAYLDIRKSILSLWIACQKIKSKIKIFYTKINKKHSNKIKKTYKIFHIEMKKLAK
jgi:hypothetical protein